MYKLMYKQYVIVRKDLPKIHWTIQSAHAAALAAELTEPLDHYPPAANERHMVILEVKNKFQLRMVSWYLKYCCNIKIFQFVEEYQPVSKWGMTALSFYVRINKYDNGDEVGNPVPFLKLLEVD